MIRVIPIVCALVVAGCASCKPNEDSSPVGGHSVGDRDLIFTTDECSPCTRGFGVVRLNVGARPDARIQIALPQVKCGRDSCVEVSAIRKDGADVPLGSVPAGHTEFVFSASKLTRLPDKVSPPDYGPHLIKAKIYQELKAGLTLREVSGWLWYVVITDPSYRPLSCDSPDTAYVVEVKDLKEVEVPECLAVYTTRFRSAQCGKGCE